MKENDSGGLSKEKEKCFQYPRLHKTTQSKHPKISRCKRSGFMTKEIGQKYLDERDEEILRNKAFLGKLVEDNKTFLLRNELLNLCFISTPLNYAVPCSLLQHRAKNLLKKAGRKRMVPVFSLMLVLYQFFIHLFPFLAFNLK